MTNFRPLIHTTVVLLGLMFLVPGCVVEPREGFFDRDHHRYYHEHAWHSCANERDEHCH